MFLFPNSNDIWQFVDLLFCWYLGCFHLGFLGLKMLCEHVLLLFLGKYLGWELLGRRAAVYLFLWEAAKQLSGGLSYFTCLPSVSRLHSPRKSSHRLKLWWHLSKEYLPWCLGWERFLWESSGKKKIPAKRRQRIGTHQIEFTRTPALGDHVGSGLHSYQSRLYSLLMTFTPHAKPSVRDPRNLGNLLSLLKLYFIEILFGVSLLVTSSLSCPCAKAVGLSIASLSIPAANCTLGSWYQSWPTWGARVASLAIASWEHAIYLLASSP